MRRIGRCYTCGRRNIALVLKGMCGICARNRHPLRECLACGRVCCWSVQGRCSRCFRRLMRPEDYAWKEPVRTAEDAAEIERRIPIYAQLAADELPLDPRLEGLIAC